jgi:hypothetical protein
LYYIPHPDLKVPDIADKPSIRDVENAKNLLLEIVCDFPFENDAALANALAAIMTPVLRPLVDGPVPMVLFDAPQAGTGKSLMSDITSLISTGRTSAVLTAPSDEDEEWRKAITSLLMQGRNVVTVDNIEGQLASSSLASVLTSYSWQDRILGRSEMVIIPHRATWIGTGNNIHLGGDLPRRCYWVRLDAKNARPWQRKGFKHPHLIEWITENRGEILIAILTIAKAWIQNGRPKKDPLPLMGSFEKWVEVIASILNYVNLPGFLDNIESMYESTDEDTPQWDAFITTWYEQAGNKFYTVKELVSIIEHNPKLEEALPDEFAGSIEKISTDPLNIKTKIDKNFTKKLGKALSKRANVACINGLFIQKGKSEQRALTWRIVNNDSEINSPNSQNTLFPLVESKDASSSEINSPNSLPDINV